MEKKKGLFARVREGLSKTRKAFSEKIDQLVKYYTQMDDDFFDDLEALLISTDMGVATATQLVEALRAQVKQQKIGDAAQVRQMLCELITARLAADGAPGAIEKGSVVLVIGVNGVGKTTSIGKIASQLKSEGKSVLIAAADTFRAAAAEQLQTWGRRADVQVIRHEEGSDPAAVVFDAVASAKARGIDVLLIDTAGRLHNKKNLMNELEKINRVIAREYPEAKKETLLVLDATTGQNALSQAKTFGEAVGLTGVVLTKLDGTAKGGVVVAIQSELGVPVRYVGVGESIDDLQPFDAEAFAKALFV
nr:signal recognition particle-docking protein FtsY [Maliibacterium massiliense]